MLRKILKLSLPNEIVLRHVNLKTRRELALTFDDGPVPNRTEEVLEILGQTHHKATFFLIGDRVKKHPELTEEIHRAGHEIGNHSWSHPASLPKLRRDSLIQQIEWADQAIEAATGKRPVLFRPPFGSVGVRMIYQLKKAGRLPLVLWSVEPGGPNAMLDRSGGLIERDMESRALSPGDILLMHDPTRSTIQGLPAVLQRIDALGLRSVTVSALTHLRGTGAGDC